MDWRWCLLVGGLGFEHLGLSSELGALLLGVLLASHSRRPGDSKALWSLKEVLLVGFSCKSGWKGGQSGHAGRALLLALLFAAQGGVVFILTAFRLRARTAFLTALALASYSEVCADRGEIHGRRGRVDSNGWCCSP